MHDKQVRRRRAVLGLLVGASLILLTAYFGESPSSPLHTVQRGIVEVLSPIQEGASKVLSPVRSAANWISDTLNAKSEVGRLRLQNEKLVARLAELQQDAIDNQQYSKLLNLDNSDSIDAYSPLTADVIGQDPSLWFRTIEVNKGSDDGVHANDPVIGDYGLVGKVTTVGATYSIVTLLTDPSFGVVAEVQDGSGDTGILVPQAGNPEALLLTYLNSTAPIADGQLVVTAGYSDPSDPVLNDLYPAGIAIGKVSDFSQDTLANDREVQVGPLVDLRDLSVVQILTRVSATTQRAQVTGG
ncbi:MAG: rod shape-determining protein MreC [Solirubrobacteraceae bacterium]